jgi:UDP-N-acetylglucosamine 4,6-dehydratase
VSNEAKLRQAMNGVKYVFHAAALKHLPSCKFYPMEILRTNVIGIENVLNADEVKSLLLKLDSIKDELHA